MIIEQMKGKLTDGDLKYFAQKEKLWTGIPDMATREEAFNRMGRQVSFLWVNRLAGNREPAGTLVERWRRVNKIVPDLPTERRHSRIQPRADRRDSRTGVSRPA